MGASLLRHRLWVIIALAALGAAVNQGEDPFDTELFIGAARRMVSGRWADAFVDPDVQVGPLYLALCWLLAGLADLLDVHYTVVFGPTTEIAAALAIVLVARRARSAFGVPISAWQELAVGVLLVIWDIAGSAYLYGHPAQVAIPLLWVLAAVRAREGAVLVPSLLVAASAGLESWGALGAMALLLIPRWYDVGRGMVTAGAATLVLYLPFYMFGDVRTGEYVWPVTDAAPLRSALVQYLGPTLGWGFRLAQGAVAGVVGAAAALALRRRPDAVWAAPFAALLVRLVIDPVNHPYYWVAPQVLFLIAAVTLSARSSKTSLVAVGLAYAVMVVEGTSFVFAPGVALLGVTILVVAERLRGSRTESGESTDESSEPRAGS